MSPSNNQGKIIGTLVYLRPITLADVTERYCSWLNDPRVTRYLETHSSTMSQLSQYVRDRIDNPDVRFWGIFDNITNEHVGNLKFEPINWKECHTILGIMIGDERYWGRGISSEITRLVSDYAFRVLGLSEVRLGVLVENIPAWKSYLRAGFIESSRVMTTRSDGSRAEEILMTRKRE